MGQSEGPLSQKDVASYTLLMCRELEELARGVGLFPLQGALARAREAAAEALQARQVPSGGFEAD